MKTLFSPGFLIRFSEWQYKFFYLWGAFKLFFLSYYMTKIFLILAQRLSASENEGK